MVCSMMRNEAWRFCSAFGNYTNPGPNWCKSVSAWNAANAALRHFGQNPLGSSVPKDWYNPATAIALGYAIFDLPNAMLGKGSVFPWEASWKNLNSLADRGEMLLRGALLLGKGGERVATAAELCGIVASFASIFFADPKPFVPKEVKASVGAGDAGAAPSGGGTAADPADAARQGRFDRLMAVKPRVDQIKAIFATTVKIVGFAVGGRLEGRWKTCFVVAKAASSVFEVGVGVFDCYVNHVRTKPSLAK